MTAAPASARAEHRWRLALTALTALVVLWVAARGWRLGVDSSDYLDGRVFRTPVYPVLLDAARGLFGPERGLTAVFLFQTVFGCGAALALTVRLRRLLELPRWLGTLLLLLLLEPFYGHLEVGNRILTEPLAYGILLLLAGRLLEFVAHRRTADWLAVAALTALAILNRPQFLFLLPVEALVLLAVAPARQRWRRLGGGAAVLAVAVSSVWLVDHGYRWVRHGSFAAVPFIGMQLAVAALHLARPGDAELFDGTSRELFVELQRAVEEKELAASPEPTRRGAIELYRGYRAAYNPLLWKTVLPLLCERTFGRDCVSAEQYLKAERILVGLSLPLLAAHAGEWARLLAANVLTYLGFWYLVVAVMVLAAGRRRSRAAVQRSLALVAGLSVANLALVALVEPVLRRYAFYTDVLVVALAAAALVDLAHPVARPRPRARPGRASNGARSPGS